MWRLPALLLWCFWCCCLCLSTSPSLAQNSSKHQNYGPPPVAPPPLPDEVPGDAPGDVPRRDYHMGTVDNMHMGRDADGNEIMEIGPRAKANEEQPQVGPFYIYPQVGNMPGNQQGSQQSGQSTGGQQGRSGQSGQTGQSGRAGQSGQAGQSGRTGQSGQPMPRSGQQPTGY